ncbi:phosphoribosylanthranilate isomerase [Naumannella huperziae]
MTTQHDRIQQSRVMLKVCGATQDADVDILAASGADLVGLWHGVSGGAHELSLGQLARLAALARAGRTRFVEPVLVSFHRDPGTIVTAASTARINLVQLHGYQPPGLVRVLKRELPTLVVVKVLHVSGADCVERGLLDSYQRAGTDIFLLDATGPRGRVGSTGTTIESRVVAELAETFDIPFILAGGISAHNRCEFDDIAAHDRFVGVDVDTAARNERGEFCTTRIRQIRKGWQQG